MNKKLSALKNERGQGLAIVAMGLGSLAIVGVTAIAVDMAHQSHVAGEVQALADVTALAAARAAVTGGNATTDANTLAGQNRVNGQTGSAVGGATCTPSGGPCAAVQTGTYTAGAFTVTNRIYSSGTFTAGGGAPNAVEVHAFAQVNNIIGGLHGTLSGFTSSMTTEKSARAAFQTIGGGTPTLPMVIGECAFGNGLPTLIQAPNPTDNSAWTGFSGGTGQSSIQTFMPTPCGSGGGTVPALAVGNSLNLTNGQLTPVLTAVQCMYCTLGIHSFLVPVVSCSGNFNGSSTVTGFATIVIDSFHFSNGGTRICQNGGGSVDGINLHAIFNAQAPGPPGGCAQCGTGFISIVG